MAQSTNFSQAQPEEEFLKRFSLRKFTVPAEKLTEQSTFLGYPIDDVLDESKCRYSNTAQKRFRIEYKELKKELKLDVPWWLRAKGFEGYNNTDRLVTLVEETVQKIYSSNCLVAIFEEQQESTQPCEKVVNISPAVNNTEFSQSRRKSTVNTNAPEDIQLVDKFFSASRKANNTVVKRNLYDIGLIEKRLSGVLRVLNNFENVRLGSGCEKCNGRVVPNDIAATLNDMCPVQNTHESDDVQPTKRSEAMTDSFCVCDLECIENEIKNICCCLEEMMKEQCHCNDSCSYIKIIQRLHNIRKSLTEIAKNEVDSEEPSTEECPPEILKKVEYFFRPESTATQEKKQKKKKFLDCECCKKIFPCCVKKAKQRNGLMLSKEVAEKNTAVFCKEVQTDFTEESVLCLCDNHNEICEKENLKFNEPAEKPTEVFCKEVQTNFMDESVFCLCDSQNEVFEKQNSALEWCTREANKYHYTAQMKGEKLLKDLRCKKEKEYMAAMLSSTADTTKTKRCKKRSYAGLSTMNEKYCRECPHHQQQDDSMQTEERDIDLVEYKRNDAVTIEDLRYPIEKREITIGQDIETTDLETKQSDNEEMRQKTRYLYENQIPRKIEKVKFNELQRDMEQENAPEKTEIKYLYKNENPWNSEKTSNEKLNVICYCGKETCASRAREKHLKSRTDFVETSDKNDNFVVLGETQAESKTKEKASNLVAERSYMPQTEQTIEKRGHILVDDGPVKKQLQIVVDPQEQKPLQEEQQRNLTLNSETSQNANRKVTVADISLYNNVSTTTKTLNGETNGTVNDKDTNQNYKKSYTGQQEKAEQLNSIATITNDSNKRSALKTNENVPKLTAQELESTPRFRDIAICSYNTEKPKSKSKKLELPSKSEMVLPTNFCHNCYGTSVPIIQNNLAEEIRKITGNQKRNSVFIKFTVGENNLYHMQMSTDSDYLGCLYATESATIQTRDSNGFDGYITLCVTGTSNTLMQIENLVDHAFIVVQKEKKNLR